jgi:hypothetical protein
MFCLRILFAEHFNERLVYNLIGFVQRNPALTVDVVIVSPKDDIEQTIRNSMTACGVTVSPRSLRLSYHRSSLRDYLLEWRRKNLSPFNYIEYNNGVMISSTTSSTSAEEIESKIDVPEVDLDSESVSELSLLREALADDNGILGLTYFSKNTHQERLFRLLRNRDENVHDPFSKHPEHLVGAYLDAHGMGFLKEDDQLMHFFGGRVGENNYRSMPENANWTMSLGEAFSQSEMEALLRRHGMEIRAWFPTAYSHPYGTFVC